MVDNSRLFACIENAALTDTLINRFRHSAGITLTRLFGRKKDWLDLRFRGQEFSIFAGTGDLLLFAANRHCPEKMMQDLIRIAKNASQHGGGI